jgi:tRNA threonylcarbamoyl adenosine modification protein YeaZ
MALLILDTSTDYMLMGLVEDGNVLAYVYERLNRQHAEQLLPQLKKLLTKSSRTIDDLKVGCISIGPGSFTGIRLGLTFIKVLALSKKINLVPVSSLLMLGLKQGVTFAWIDARAKRMYGALYDHGNEIIPPRIWTVEEVDERLQHYPNAVRITFDETLDVSAHLIALAHYVETQQPVRNFHTLVPLYLKDLQ